ESHGSDGSICISQLHQSGDLLSQSISMGPPREELILDAIHRLGGSWNMSKTGLTVKAWWVAFDLKVVPCRCSRISTFRFYTFVIAVLHYLKHGCISVP